MLEGDRSESFIAACCAPRAQLNMDTRRASTPRILQVSASRMRALPPFQLLSSDWRDLLVASAARKARGMRLALRQADQNRYAESTTDQNRLALRRLTSCGPSARKSSCRRAGHARSDLSVTPAFALQVVSRLTDNQICKPLQHSKNCKKTSLDQRLQTS